MSPAAKPATDAAVKRQSDDTRERILEVAIDEFAHKGFAGARVDEIARKAQANKQLVYYYFGGKLSLYQEVLDRMVEGSQAKIVAESECDTLAEKLRTMASLSTEENAARWQRLLSWEALETDSRDFVRMKERRAAWRRHVDNVTEAQRNGEVDDELDPELLALALVSIVVAPYVLPQVTKLVTGLLPTDEKFRRRHDALLAELVAHLA